MTITILCAGALALPAGHDDEAAQPLTHGALARRLGRARVLRRARDDAAVPDELPHEAWLRECFGIAGSLAGCALSAGCSETACAGPKPSAGTGTVDTLQAAADDALLVRPVHLHVGLDHLRLAPPRLLGIDANEAQALAQHANQMLADSGLVVQVVQADTWALTALPGAAAGERLLAELAALHARSTRMAEGRQIDLYLPSGPAARQWRRLSTEVQMAWFEHPVNRQRDDSGRAAINSLWLEGRAGRAARRPFDLVMADDPAIIGLARRTGIDCRPFGGQPFGRQQPPVVVGSAAAARYPLIAFDRWHAPGSDGDVAGWRRAWHDLSDWFDRNQSALAAPLRLVLTGERSLAELRLAPGDRWAFRRRLRLADLLESGA